MMDAMMESGKRKSKQTDRLNSDDLINDFVVRLKRGEVQGGDTLAVLTVDLIRTIISRRKLTTVDDLIDHLHYVGKVLTDAKPQELVTGNIVRRILRIVRQEGKGLVDEIEREEEKERSAATSAASSAAASPSASPPSRSLSSSPPPSMSIKRSFSSANVDASLSLHSLLDQPSSSPSLMSLDTMPSSPHASVSPFHPSASGPVSASTAPVVPSSLAASKQASASPGSRRGQALSSVPAAAPSKDEERAQREWLSARLLAAIYEEISLLLDELSSSCHLIAEQATEHIYANESILVYGLNDVVTAFLKEAARFRRFEVMVVEGAPTFGGHEQALLLSSAPHPIETTVIADSAVYAIMPAINKCIMGCHAVMANGSLLVPAGGHNIALAAKRHSVPVIVLTGLHRLSTLYSHQDDRLNVQQAPSQLLAYDGLAATDTAVRVHNPLYEEVGAAYVSLLITNVGGHNPSYIYRLLSDHYHSLDYQLRGGAAAASSSRQHDAQSTQTAPGRVAAGKSGPAVEGLEERNGRKEDGKGRGAKGKAGGGGGKERRKKAADSRNSLVDE